MKNILSIKDKFIIKHTFRGAVITFTPRGKTLRPQYLNK